MKVEYDPSKRAETLSQRDLDMARAPEVFEGDTLSVPDHRFDYGEERFITIGFLDNRMVVLAWTRRADVTRIISMRKANAREQKAYGPRFDAS